MKRINALNSSIAASNLSDSTHSSDLIAFFILSHTTLLIVSNMFSKTHLATVALALAHLPSAFALATFTPYADASCTEQVTITDNNGQTYTEVGTGSGLNSDSPAGWINQATYSVNATSGKSGVDVWWSVDGLDTGCRAALLLGYTQGNYGSMGNNTVPGNVVVNAKSGCIYSNLPVSPSVHFPQKLCDFTNKKERLKGRPWLTDGVYSRSMTLAPHSAAVLMTALFSVLETVRSSLKEMR